MSPKKTSFFATLAAVIVLTGLIGGSSLAVGGINGNLAFVWLAISIPVGIYAWHTTVAARPASWLLYAGGLVIGSAASFALDCVVGAFFYPDVPLMEAGLRSPPFIITVGMLCLIPVALAGWVHATLLSWGADAPL
jgi:hypothetical protein